jgi:hypothetical protein
LLVAVLPVVFATGARWGGVWDVLGGWAGWAKYGVLSVSGPGG